jgi:hypothetical protein
MSVGTPTGFGQAGLASHRRLLLPIGPTPGPWFAIARRYLKSLRNLFRLYMPLANRTLIFDNSAEKPSLIADLQPSSQRILNKALFNGIKRQIQEADHE